MGECDVLEKQCLPCMQAPISHARPLAGLLRLITHVSQLCSSTLLLPQYMTACLQANEVRDWMFQSE